MLCRRLYTWWRDCVIADPDPVPIRLDVLFEVLAESWVFFVIAVIFAGMLFAGLDPKQPLSEVMGNGVVTGVGIAAAVILVTRLPDRLPDLFPAAEEEDAAPPDERN